MFTECFLHVRYFHIPFESSTFIRPLLQFTEEERRLPEVTNSYKVSTSGLCSYQDPLATLTFSEFKGVPLAPFPAPIFKQGCDHFEGPRRRPPLTPQLRYTTHVSPNRRQALPYCSSQHSTQSLVKPELPFQDFNPHGQSLVNLRRVPHGIALTF